MNQEAQSSETNEEPNAESKNDTSFKKPTILIGKRGSLPRKVQTVTKVIEEANNENSTENEENNVDTAEKTLDIPSKPSLKSPAQQQAENSIPLPYKEPTWSGLPESNGKPYTFEVLKNGSIIETIDLMKKPFWVFGRLPACDLCMQHPTISRYHAVLQYRDVPSEDDPPGFYIYDLGSTHGTFLNGKNNKLKPKMYAPLKVGHMLRLGCSQRSYILTGPEDDQEDESELSVTELKQLRLQKIKEHEEKMRQAELEQEEKRKREEEKGVDWGMGDDAEDEGEVGENPFASTNNEDLYLDDPKKALRGFFEREGLDLEYDCTEQGIGNFLCKVQLPLDDEMGKPLVAEAVHRGKKKEAVVQCALEACRILDRFGVLRQATHESKKRKSRNWEENDYYDSDEDTFLDRTGTIEKKREKRMKVKEPEKAETYESLIEKEKTISKSISDIERKLTEAQAKLEEGKSESNVEEDSLDSYMKGLSSDKPDKQAISRMRLDLANLRKSHAHVVRLANIAKPANLPALVPSTSSNSTTVAAGNKKSLPIFGKRKAIPVKFPAKPVVLEKSSDTVEEEEDEDSGDKGENVSTDKEAPTEQNEDGKTSEDAEVKPKSPESPTNCTENKEESSTNNQTEETTSEPTENTNSDQSISQNDSISDSDSSEEGEPMEILQEFRPIKNFHDTETFRKFEEIMRSGLPAVADKHKKKLVKILRKLQRLASNEDRMHSDWKILSAKKRKVMKWIGELRQSEVNEKLEFRVSTELNRILNELNTMTEDKFKVIGQVKQMGVALKTISMEIDRDIQELKRGIPEIDPALPGTSKDCNDEIDERKKKKNQRRTEQRQHKNEMEKQRGYEEDSTREDYNMWVPPSGQSGDGRTSLNDKYGY